MMPTWEVREDTTPLPDQPGRPQHEEVVRLITVPHSDLVELVDAEAALAAFVDAERRDMEAHGVEGVEVELSRQVGYPYDATLARLCGIRALGPTTPQRRLLPSTVEPHPESVAGTMAAERAHAERIAQSLTVEPERVSWWRRTTDVPLWLAWLVGSGIVLDTIADLARLLTP